MMNIDIAASCSQHVMFDVKQDESVIKRFIMTQSDKTGIELKEVPLNIPNQGYAPVGNSNDILNRGVLGLEAQLRAVLREDLKDDSADRTVFGYTDYSYCNIRDWIRERVIECANRDWEAAIDLQSEESVSFDLSKIKDLYAVMNDGTKISITNNILKVSK
ncbi:hypothetical protein [Yersinia phage MHG19]|nr:hypothetical protein [Yersinia phage MHG19]